MPHPSRRGAHLARLHVLVGNEPGEERAHDDGRGEVVQHGGEKEGDRGRDDEQRPAVRGADLVRDECEAIMGIHSLNKGHGAHQEEDDLADAGKRLVKIGYDLFDTQIARVPNEAPANNSHNQSGR